MTFFSNHTLLLQPPSQVTQCTDHVPVSYDDLKTPTSAPTHKINTQSHTTYCPLPPSTATQTTNHTQTATLGPLPHNTPRNSCCYLPQLDTLSSSEPPSPASCHSAQATHPQNLTLCVPIMHYHLTPTTLAHRLLILPPPPRWAPSSPGLPHLPTVNLDNLPTSAP
jgi:hypothetical protein